MKARLIFACAFAGIAASAFGVTPASADEEFRGSIAFSPDVVNPGDSVDLIGRCNNPKLTTAPVVSEILEASDLTKKELNEGGWVMYSHAKVKKDARPGDWPVGFKCGTVNVLGHLRVEAPSPKPGPYAAIGIQDREIRPGQEVAIIATCDDSNFVSSKVISSVLVAPDLRRDPNAASPNTMAVLGWIDRDAKPGAHSLSFICAGKKVSGKFTILGKQAPVQAQVPVKPKGAAETGAIVSQPVEDVSNPTGFVLGGAGALLAAAGAGVWLYRRRQRA